jgi:hypothetical protein
MADFIKIRNWDKWQSYRKDRGQPPWIKIHRCVMRNPEWVSLTDAERGQLVAIWLLAADHDGAIPTSPGIIKKLCYLDNEPNLNKLADLGFLDAIATPPRRHRDQPETETETETDKKHISQKNNFATVNDSEFYLTAKKKKLSGKRLETFNQFWESFNYKKDKAKAADAWLSIPELTTCLVNQICEAAKKEAMDRKQILNEGRTPIYAQGWLTAKRWEDEINDCLPGDDIYEPPEIDDGF